MCGPMSWNPQTFKTCQHIQDCFMLTLSVCTYIVTSDQEPDSIRPSTVTLSGNLSFYNSDSRKMMATLDAGKLNNTNPSCASDFCGDKWKDTASNQRHQSRHRKRPIKHKPGIQTLLSHEVTVETPNKSLHYWSITEHQLLILKNYCDDTASANMSVGW